MSDETVYVAFTVPEGGRERFLSWLQRTTDGTSIDGDLIGSPLGYRADDSLQRREALVKFTERMETVLRKHDSKSSWRTDPIDMLVRKLKLELMEFEVAYDFQRWEEARNEAVDLANFCLIVFDRLSQPDFTGATK